MLVGAPDFNGSPPVTLRLRANDGRIKASYSAGGTAFREIGQPLDVAVLGENLRAGVRFTTSTVEAGEWAQSPRFYWYREGVLSLTSYR